MNNYFKIVSILLIILYCLSPLATIDLNDSDGGNISQGSNVNTINDSYKDNVTEAVKIDVKDELKDPNLSIHIADIQEGETGTIEVTADKSFNERLYVEIGNNLIPVKITNGYGVCKIEKLAKGHYNAKISFQGNDEFKASQCSAEFNVIEKTKIDSNLRISVKNVEKDEPVVIEFYADKDFKGTVIGGVGDKYFIVWVENGYAKVVIDDLPAGEYTVDAIYFGDGKYKEWKGSANFEVICKKDLNMKVDTREIWTMDFIDFHPVLVAEHVEVSVNTDPDFTGTVHVNVCNQSQDIQVKNGYRKELIHIGPLEGNFTCETTFPGNDIYKASKVLTNFEMVQDI